jgi:hypothetical protein
MYLSTKLSKILTVRWSQVLKRLERLFREMRLFERTKKILRNGAPY